MTLLSVSNSLAQARIELGPRLGIDVGGDIEELFIGADARISVVTLPVLLNPVFDFYFTDDPLTFWQLGLNVLYPLNAPTIDLYVGGGLGINRTSVDADFGDFRNSSASDTSVGVNLIGGTTFNAGALKPFAQAQISLGDVDLFTLAVGLLFSLGN
ncbi:hypothetical protein GQ464_015970 [Rhodocaloribacter litoris]|uniref:outer membrane protein n=1 Tax=Rhodocaloribacter litoris TaxID=2558931 RepID=UPI001E4762E7|nr:hypothetical protein [Rhodocaloribacter litoris]QXD14894.1 hypothetical protein GQ464_015970 [Rhodocaloribacter litoris]